MVLLIQFLKFEHLFSLVFSQHEGGDTHMDPPCSTEMAVWTAAVCQVHYKHFILILTGSLQSENQWDHLDDKGEALESCMMVGSPTLRNKNY